MKYHFAGHPLPDDISVDALNAISETAAECRRLARRLAEVEAERDARPTWDVFGGCLRQETQRRKAAEARLAAVLALCHEILGTFKEKGHPGRACLRTGWIAVEHVERWRAAAAGDPPAAEPVPYCPDCDLGSGHTGPHMKLTPHEPGVADCPCASCVDRFLDGQQ